MAGADESGGYKPVFVSTLDEGFVKLMDQIGLYGLQKYGEKSFQHLLKHKLPLDTERLRESLIHCKDHVEMYENIILHDKFNTLEHQLAAAAFNLMMEYIRVREETKKNQSI